MFENIANQAPQGVEDIFSGAEPVGAPPVLPLAPGIHRVPGAPSPLQLVPPTPQPAGSMPRPVSLPLTPDHPPRRLRLVVVVGLVLAVGVLAAGYWWWSQSGATPAASLTSTPPATTTPESPTPTPESPVAMPPEPATPGLDSDGDGLPDTQEQALGTDSHAPDTDGDGLFDGEEVNVYHSDPLKADTDADGYSDGVEVKNGYNPLGPGKLLNLPTPQP